MRLFLDLLAWLQSLLSFLLVGLHTHLLTLVEPIKSIIAVLQGTRLILASRHEIAVKKSIFLICPIQWGFWDP
jgi:hypothetical protein